MEQVRKFEVKLTEWYNKMPHLPQGGRKWLADNAWWLVIIGIVLSAWGVIGLIFAIFLATTLFAGMGLAFGGIGLAAAGAGIGALLLISSLLSMALFIVELIMLIKAVTPLKVHKKHGWNLLYYVALLNVVFNVVINLLHFDLWSAIVSVVFAAIGGYFLFEIRGYFVAKKEAKSETTPKEA